MRGDIDPNEWVRPNRDDGPGSIHWPTAVVLAGLYIGAAAISLGVFYTLGRVIFR